MTHTTSIVYVIYLSICLQIVKKFHCKILHTRSGLNIPDGNAFRVWILFIIGNCFTKIFCEDKDKEINLTNGSALKMESLVKQKPKIKKSRV